MPVSKGNIPINNSENLLRIKFKYTTLILPYDEGLKLIACLKNAELWDNDTDYNNPVIAPLSTSSIEVSILAKEEYDLRKMSRLLGITYKELLEQHQKEIKNGTDK